MKISEKYDLRINEVAYSGELLSLTRLVSSEICLCHGVVWYMFTEVLEENNAYIFRLELLS
jgi:hypothetical protein